MEVKDLRRHFFLPNGVLFLLFYGLYHFIHSVFTLLRPRVNLLIGRGSLISRCRILMAGPHCPGPSREDLQPELSVRRDRSSWLGGRVSAGHGERWGWDPLFFFPFLRCCKKTRRTSLRKLFTESWLVLPGWILISARSYESFMLLLPRWRWRGEKVQEVFLSDRNRRALVWHMAQTQTAGPYGTGLLLARNGDRKFG